MSEIQIIETQTPEQKIESLQKALEYSNKKVSLYENGEQNLYRSLQRKMNEISLFLNSIKLDQIDLTDKNSKEFERVFVVLEKSEKLANAVKNFGEMCGAVSVKEEKKSFIDTIADKRD
jgi:hypothetical protein